MEIIAINDADLVEIECKRHRILWAISTPLTAEVILNDIQTHHRERVIVICNTVSQAQGLFRDLNNLNSDEALNITLFHSRFLPEHRAQKETQIKTRFAENWQDDGLCHVLISTQVIEAGLNITCDVMHTELSPMNSLLQRAGRCARFKGEQGEVYVYWQIQVNPESLELAAQDFDPESEEPTVEKKSFLPYEKTLCELTWQVLQQHTQSEQLNQSVGFTLEQVWINQVHWQADSLQAERRKNDQAEFERRFNDAIFNGDRSTADNLIRCVDNRSVFVWNEPTLIDLDNESIDPKKLLAFCVPTTALCKAWQEIQNLGYETDWVFKRIEAPRRKDTETYAQPICTTIRSRNDLINSIQILVNPRYVHYDEEIGLLIGINIVGNGFTSPNKPQKQVISEYRYRMDTYVGHLGCMWTCWHNPFTTRVLKNGSGVEIEYASVRDELLKAGRQFIQQKIFPQVTIAEAEALFEYLVLLAVFTHDLGKLQQKWQDAMGGWQAIAHSSFHGKPPKSHLLAHTDYNPDDRLQRDALKAYEAKHKRPNHAVESGFLAQYILQESLVPLLRDYFHAESEQIFGIAYTILLAAGRHHSAWAKGWEMKDIRKVGEIQLHPKAKEAIASSWRSLTRFLPKTLPFPETIPNLKQTRYSAKELDLNKFSSAQIDYLQLYWLVVRSLRLCDQRSVQIFKPTPN
ncbi:CRISPR-associated helicase Cas3' [Coleofasciculus sp. H7-2]|uniref:CRISPR-associated helicase Cas3' n=1 Tax=Coleofasciculus sp. H7-2 TaxID=3351545 RepID=UPI00366EF2B4